MIRYFTGGRMIIATHNKGKLRELGALLSFHVKDLVSAAALGLPEPEETGTTFVDNAILKARTIAKTSGSPALADDSGLCVNALDGAPGIFSARWGGPTKDFSMAMQLVHDKIGDNPDRSAYFICTLALAWPDGHVVTVEGRVDGTIVWPPRGEEGHGYDPFFMPAGHSETFAEMPPEEKHALSHRGKAVRELIRKHFKQP